MLTQEEIGSIRIAVKNQVLTCKEGISVSQIQANTQVDKKQVTKALKFLESQSIIQKEKINKDTVWKSAI